MSELSDTKKSTIYIIQAVIVGILPVLLYPIITEKLNPDVFGIYALTIVYTSILIGIANLGCIVGYERNFFLVETSNEKSGKLLTTTQLFVLTLFFIVVLVGSFFSEPISMLLFNDSSFALLWQLVLASTCISTFSQYYLTYLKNVGLAKTFFQITILQATINFIVAWVLLMNTDYGIYSLAYALLVSNTVMLLVAIHNQLSRLSLGLDKQLLIEVLRISLPLTPRVLFGFINTQFDKIMLGILASMSNVGVYAIAQKIALFIFVFMTALDRTFKPKVFRMLFSDDKPEDIGKYLTKFVFISLLPALMLILFSFEVVTLLLSEAYSDATSIIVVLSIYYASLFIGKINGIQLTYAKKTWLISKLTLWGVLLNVILNVPFIYLWGAIGAAFATTIASLILTGITYHYAQRYAPIKLELGYIYWMYIVLILSSFVIIGIEVNIIDIDYYLAFGMKLVFVLLYMYLGKQAGVIRWEDIKKTMQIIKIKTRTID